MFITLAVIAGMFLCLRISTYAGHSQGRWTAILLSLSMVGVWVGHRLPEWGGSWHFADTAAFLSKTILFAGRYVFALYGYWYIHDLIGTTSRRRVMFEIGLLLMIAIAAQTIQEPLIAELMGSSVHLATSLYLCWQAGRHVGIFSHSKQATGAGFIIPAAVLYYLLYEKARLLVSTDQWYWLLHLPMIYCSLYWLLVPCFSSRRPLSAQAVEPIHGFAVLMHTVKNEAVKMSLVYDRLVVESRSYEMQPSENLHMLQHSSKHLLGMAERISTKSAVHLQLLEQPCRVQDLIEEALQQCRSLLNRTPAVAIERQYECDPVIKADRIHLKEVLMNLLCNASDAIEEDGRITLAIAPANKGGVEISVRDSGKGIPKQLHRHVFTPYFSTKGGQSHSYGLGLWYSNRIVRKSGAVMSFESEAGKGSLFRIAIPRRKVVEPDIGAKQ